ncbi:isocitrate lyase/phosphoenolpyruvate mutase family protein [Streptomyces capparidis]
MTAAALRELHHGPDPLVLPNVWDAAGARAFAEAGFPALATTSAGVAASLGYADREGTPPEEMFAAVARIARAVPVPVTADMEAGYGLSAAELVDRLLAAGAVGCNLEDTDPRSGEQRPPERQARWLAEVRAAAGDALVVNARVDTFLPGRGGGPADAVARGRCYLEAGADCVYPIFAPAELLPELAAGTGGPVNALHLPGGPSPERLGELGAARVTFGAGLFRRALGLVDEMARELTAR